MCFLVILCMICICWIKKGSSVPPKNRCINFWGGGNVGFGVKCYDTVSLVFVICSTLPPDHIQPDFFATRLFAFDS